MRKLLIATVLLAMPMTASAWSAARWRVARVRDLGGMMLSRAHHKVLPKVASRMLRHRQGPLSVLTAGGKTAVIPREIESGAQAALIGGNGDVAWLTLTYANAVHLRREVEQQNIDAAVRAVSAQFDGRVQ